MEPNSDIEKELREISPAVSEIGKENVFQVPPGYFENLPQKVVALVNLNEEQANISANEEITQLSPLIAALKSTPALSVPAGYFNTFPGIILGKLADETREKTPVISIRKSKKRKWLSYAAAAAIIGITSTLLLLNTGNSHKMIPVAQSDGIQPVSTGLPGIADIDLASYLSTVPQMPEWDVENTNPEFENLAFLKIDDTNLSDMLRDIPDETLRNYEQDISGEMSL